MIFCIAIRLSNKVKIYEIKIMLIYKQIVIVNSVF